MISLPAGIARQRHYDSSDGIQEQRENYAEQTS